MPALYIYMSIDEYNKMVQSKLYKVRCVNRKLMFIINLLSFINIEKTLATVVLQGFYDYLLANKFFCNFTKWR